MADATRGFPAFDLTSQNDVRSHRSESVGAELRRLREERNITVFQACNDLRLKESVVRAIESGQHSSLPDIPFAIGYVRTYARYLGLDPRATCDRFKSEIADLAKAKSSAVLIAPSPLRQGRLSGSVLLAVSIVLGAAIYGGWYLHVTGSGDTATRTEAPRSTIGAVAGSPSVVMGPIEPFEPPVWFELPKAQEPPAPPVRIGSANAAEAPHRLVAETVAPPVPALAPAAKDIVLKATAQVWIQLKDSASATVIYQGMMSPGMEYRLPDDKRLMLDIGNPTALTLVFGGRVLKPLGVAGKPVHGVSLDPAELAKRP